MGRSGPGAGITGCLDTGPDLDQGDRRTPIRTCPGSGSMRTAGECPCEREATVGVMSMELAEPEGECTSGCLASQLKRAG